MAHSAQLIHPTNTAVEELASIGLTTAGCVKQLWEFHTTNVVLDWKDVMRYCNYLLPVVTTVPSAKSLQTATDIRTDLPAALARTDILNRSWEKLSGKVFALTTVVLNHVPSHTTGSNTQSEICRRQPDVDDTTETGERFASPSQVHLQSAHVEENNWKKFSLCSFQWTDLCPQTFLRSTDQTTA